MTSAAGTTTVGTAPDAAQTVAAGRPAAEPNAAGLRPRPAPERIAPLRGRSLWISDLHLEREANAVSAALFGWLESDLVQSACDLFILGDLFEYWVGDDDDSPIAAELAARLRALPARVWLQHGNRDFLIGSAYAERAGATLLHEAIVTRAGRVNVAVQHGDALCWDDQRYQAFRRQARDPAWQAGMLRLPLAARLAEAERLRAASRAAQQTTALEITDVHPDGVRAALDDADARMLIHGHTHRPAIHALDDGRLRVVLPDWDRVPGYLCLEAFETSEASRASWARPPETPAWDVVRADEGLRFALCTLDGRPYPHRDRSVSG